MSGCFSGLFKCFKCKKVPEGVQVDWTYSYTIPIDPITPEPTTEPAPVVPEPTTEPVPVPEPVVPEIEVTDSVTEEPTQPDEPSHRPGMPSPCSVQAAKQVQERGLRRA